MNETKENLRLNGKNVLIWGSILSLVLVGLIFLYVPAKPKNTGVPKNFGSYDSAGKETGGATPQTTTPGAPEGGAAGGAPENPGEVSQADAPQTALSAHSPEGIYQTYCSQCHGKTGNGDSPMARMMTVKPPNLIEGPFRFERTTEAIAAIIRNGAGTMPGFKDEISEEQALQLAGFVLELNKKP